MPTAACLTVRARVLSCQLCHTRPFPLIAFVELRRSKLPCEKMVERGRVVPCGNSSNISTFGPNDNLKVFQKGRSLLHPATRICTGIGCHPTMPYPQSNHELCHTSHCSSSRFVFGVIGRVIMNTFSVPGLEDEGSLTCSFITPRS
jgi:hypothetical protein